MESNGRGDGVKSAVKKFTTSAPGKRIAGPLHNLLRGQGSGTRTARADQHPSPPNCAARALPSVWSPRSSARRARRAVRATRR